MGAWCSARFGSSAASQNDRGWIGGYHTGLVDQIAQIANDVESVAKDAARIVNAGADQFYLHPIRQRK